jgi:hypothetical protein
VEETVDHHVWGTGKFDVQPAKIYDVNRLLDQDVHLFLTPEKEQDQAMYGND